MIYKPSLNANYNQIMKLKYLKIRIIKIKTLSLRRKTKIKRF